MNKSNRLTLIASRFRVLSGAALAMSAPLAARSQDVREEFTQTVSTDARVSDEIRDEEIVGFASTIAPEKVAMRTESETEILLTRKERAQIRRDVDGLRWTEGHAKNSWLVLAA